MRLRALAVALVTLAVLQQALMPLTCAGTAARTTG